MFVTNRRGVKLVQKGEMLLQRADGAVLPRNQRGARSTLEFFAIEVHPHRQSARLQLLGERTELRVARARRRLLVEIGSRVETKTNRVAA